MLGSSINIGSPNTLASTSAVDVLDDVKFTLGTGGTVGLIYETADANANCLQLVFPEGGATDVPVFVIGDASIDNQDLAWFNGITEPTIAVVNDAKDAYASLDAGDDAVAGSKGLYFKAAADEDIELINLSVTGTPRVFWDESEDEFRSTHGFILGHDKWLSGVKSDGTTVIDIIEVNTSNETHFESQAGIMRLQWGAGYNIHTFGHGTPSDYRTILIRSGDASAGVTTVDSPNIALEGYYWDTSSKNYIFNIQHDITAVTPTSQAVFSFGTRSAEVYTLTTRMTLSSAGALGIDTINELTAAAGVTIDGLLLKDQTIAAFTMSGDITTGAYGLLLTGANNTVFAHETSNRGITLKNTANDVTGFNLRIEHNRGGTGAAGVAGDDLLIFTIRGYNAAGTPVTKDYAKITAKLIDPTSTSEDGAWRFGTLAAGSFVEPFVIQSNAVGFFAATPQVQQATIADADGTLADITTKFNTLKADMIGFGLLAAA